MRGHQSWPSLRAWDSEAVRPRGRCRGWANNNTRDGSQGQRPGASTVAGHAGRHAVDQTVSCTDARTGARSQSRRADSDGFRRLDGSGRPAPGRSSSAELGRLSAAGRQAPAPMARGAPGEQCDDEPCDCQRSETKVMICRRGQGSCEIVRSNQEALCARREHLDDEDFADDIRWRREGRRRTRRGLVKVSAGSARASPRTRIGRIGHDRVGARDADGDAAELDRSVALRAATAPGCSCRGSAQPRTATTHMPIVKPPLSRQRAPSSGRHTRIARSCGNQRALETCSAYPLKTLDALN